MVESHRHMATEKKYKHGRHKKTVDIKEDRASEHVARKQNVQQIKPTGSKCTENRQRISTLGYVCCYY